VRRERKSATMQGRRERILFVDDEEPIVLVGMHMLERLGFDVTVARGGADALEQFVRDPSLFDVVITDQTMPGMTGLALTEELKRIRPALPIILCSGRTDLLPPQQMKRLGIAACVTKPFTRSELARAVLSALGGDERGESAVSPPP
jgi:CheY-like chemotaxis protein